MGLGHILKCIAALSKDAGAGPLTSKTAKVNSAFQSLQPAVSCVDI